MYKYLLIIVFSYSNLAFSQLNVSGVVTDSKKNPIESVAVSIINSDIETFTNSNGYYSIEVPNNGDTLNFLKYGFTGASIASASNILNVTLNKFDEINLPDLTLGELMNIVVVSASDKKEKLSEVPATTIVLTQTEIYERGYKNLTEIFSDLPGMDAIITNGYQGYNNYWRGYRASFSQPFLLMIDGLVQNESYYNRAGILHSVPISNIERVEVVYGPVSSVYGANALMGVINIVTKSDIKEGLTISATNSGTISGDFIADYFTAFKKDELYFKMATRIEKSDLSNSINFSDVEYTNPKYNLDTSLYGSYLVNTIFHGNEFSVPQNFSNIDIRAGYKNTELGVLFDSKNQSWGYYTPADKILYNTPSKFTTTNLFLKQHFSLSDKLKSEVLIGYKLEDLPAGDWVETVSRPNNSKDTVIIANKPVAPGQSIQTVDFSYWQLYNQTWFMRHKFEATLSSKLEFSFGYKYENREITKMGGVSGAFYTPAELNSKKNDFIPQRTSTYRDFDNLLKWRDYGVYTQLQYKLNLNNFLNAGLRVDNNSQYGTSTTFRGGYVGKFNELGVKALFGQAYQIPSPRTLFVSGFTFNALGTSKTLKPETSRTVEVQLNYTLNKLYAYISTYFITNKNTVVNVIGGAQNLGASNVIGIDAHAKSMLKLTQAHNLKLWAYYSCYLLAKKDIIGMDGNKTGSEHIGDLALHKFYFGTTLNASKKLDVNVRGRFIGDRKTVSTNPLGVIESYTSADANIVYKNLFVKGFDVALKVNNIFNTSYTHPGINVANSGNEPGKWVNGVWMGSAGWTNSELPQPKRYFIISLALHL